MHDVAGGACPTNHDAAATVAGNHIALGGGSTANRVVDRLIDKDAAVTIRLLSGAGAVHTDVTVRHCIAAIGDQRNPLFIKTVNHQTFDDATAAGNGQATRVRPCASAVKFDARCTTGVTIDYQRLDGDWQSGCNRNAGRTCTQRKINRIAERATAKGAATVDGRNGLTQ